MEKEILFTIIYADILILPMQMLPKMEKSGCHLGNIGKNEAPPGTFQSNYLVCMLMVHRRSCNICHVNVDIKQAFRRGNHMPYGYKCHLYINMMANSLQPDKICFTLGDVRF